jgi:rhamnulokinase
VATINQAGGDLASVGIDTWGVDFGLLDRRGRLLGNPVHYRDQRTSGMLANVTQRVTRADIYAATGIQFLEINTLYQLFAIRDELDSADRLLLMPDLLHYFLCGSTVTELTNATTTQCFDPLHGGWADALLDRLGIPRRLFGDIVPPGSVLGTVRAEGVRQSDLRVIAPGTHDTASAVAAIPLSPHGGTAYLSSGTWSLLGLEIDAPVLTAAALEANLTNEGGVGGKTRLLKNVMGLWLIQQSRRGQSYDELMYLAEAAPAGTALIDPDDPRFLRPGDVPALVGELCLESGQPAPPDTGTLMRVLMESLASKYAVVLRQLGHVAQRPIDAIHVVGGGANNTLLNRLTAEATGLPVRAGPAEATAIGNLLVQAIALGELASLDDGRALVARSFPAATYDPAPASERRPVAPAARPLPRS